MRDGITRRMANSGARRTDDAPAQVFPAACREARTGKSLLDESVRCRSCSAFGGAPVPLGSALPTVRLHLQHREATSFRGTHPSASVFLKGIAGVEVLLARRALAAVCALREHRIGTVRKSHLVWPFKKGVSGRIGYRPSGKVGLEGNS